MSEIPMSRRVQSKQPFPSPAARSPAGEKREADKFSSNKAKPSRHALVPYSDAMRNLLKVGYKADLGPSGPDISDSYAKRFAFAA